MVKRTHLLPRERQEITEHIVNKVKGQLSLFVRNQIGEFAITDKDVGEKAIEILEEQAQKYMMQPRWFIRWAFTKPKTRHTEEE